MAILTGCLGKRLRQDKILPIFRFALRPEWRQRNRRLLLKIARVAFRGVAGQAIFILIELAGVIMNFVLIWDA